MNGVTSITYFILFLILFFYFVLHSTIFVITCAFDIVQIKREIIIIRAADQIIFLTS